MTTSESSMAISRKTRAGSGRFYLLLPALFFLAIPSTQAFKLTPITMEFGTAGRGANQAFRVENESSNTVAVQISMLSRQMGLDGSETNTPADDDFVVYPPQVLLKPRQVQTVRVKWVGNPKPEKELAYRILESRRCESSGWATPSRKRNWPTGFWPNSS